MAATDRIKKMAANSYSTTSKYGMHIRIRTSQKNVYQCSPSGKNPQQRMNPENERNKAKIKAKKIAVKMTEMQNESESEGVGFAARLTDCEDCCSDVALGYCFPFCGLTATSKRAVT